MSKMSTSGNKYKKSDLDDSLNSTSPPISFESNYLTKTVNPVYLNITPYFTTEIAKDEKK